MDPSLQSIILNHILQNYPSYGILIAILSFSIFKYLNSEYHMQRQRRKYQRIFKKQQFQYKTQDSIKDKLYQNISDITKQNNQHTQFLKDSILQQFSILSAKYDILERYIIGITKKIQSNGQNIKSILLKLDKPYLEDNIAKWLMQIIIDNGNRRRLNYLSNIKNKFKQDIQNKVILDQIYRVFKQISRQEIQLTSNFVCKYGNFSKPLRQVYQTKAFNKIIYQQIAQSIKLQNNDNLVLSAKRILQFYKQHFVSLIQKC